APPDRARHPVMPVPVPRPSTTASSRSHRCLIFDYPACDGGPPAPAYCIARGYPGDWKRKGAEPREASVTGANGDPERRGGGGAGRDGGRLEAQLSADLEEARIQDRGGRQPTRTKRGLDALDRAGVQRVVGVQVGLEAHPAGELEDLRHPQIETADAALEDG